MEIVTARHEHPRDHRAAEDGASPAAAWGGDLTAGITRAMVRVHRERAGRGPTKGRAIFRGNVVLVLLEDVMTHVERTLRDSGADAEARAWRRSLHETMREDLVAAVESVTGRVVVGFLADSLTRPDMSSLVFVLDEPLLPPPPAGDPGL